MWDWKRWCPEFSNECNRQPESMSFFFFGHNIGNKEILFLPLSIFCVLPGEPSVSGSCWLYSLDTFIMTVGFQILGRRLWSYTTWTYKHSRFIEHLDQLWYGPPAFQKVLAYFPSPDSILLWQTALLWKVCGWVSSTSCCWSAGLRLFLQVLEPLQ